MDKDTSSPPTVSPIAVALLDMAREMHYRHYGPGRSRTTDRHAPGQAEKDAISALKADPEARKLVTSRNGGLDLDLDELKVLAVCLHWTLMCTSHATVMAVSELVGREIPREVLLARVAIRRLCERGVMRFRNGQGQDNKIFNGILVLQTKALTALGLCTSDSPIWGERSLGMPAPAHDADGEAAKAEQPANPKEYIPTAFVLETRIRERVKGAYLDGPIRTLAAMYVTHLHRAAMIRNGKHPLTPNVTGLLIGGSSVGKTLAAEIAAKVVNEVCGENTVPFSSFSATDLTAEGYVGCSVTDALAPLLEQCGGDAAKARYGCCLIDEFDKKAAHAARGTLDVGGTSVQEGLLRILGGATFPVGGRRNSLERQVPFNSDGTMFLLAGAFCHLAELMGRKGTGSIGFGQGTDPKAELRIRDGLKAFGFVPELISRIGSIIVFPDPQLTDLTEILTARGGLISCYGKLWQGMGISISLAGDGIKAMAAYGIETGSFARGMQTVCNRLTEQLVADGKTGHIRLSVRDIKAVIDTMGSGG